MRDHTGTVESPYPHHRQHHEQEARRRPRRPGARRQSRLRRLHAHLRALQHSSPSSWSPPAPSPARAPSPSSPPWTSHSAASPATGSRVWECIDITHRGKRHPMSADLIELSNVLSGWMLFFAGKATSPEARRESSPTIILRQRRSLQACLAQTRRAPTAAIQASSTTPRAFHKASQPTSRSFRASHSGYLSSAWTARKSAGPCSAWAPAAPIPGDPVSAHAGIESHAKLGDRILNARRPHLHALHRRSRAQTRRALRMLEATSIASATEPNRTPFSRSSARSSAHSPHRLTRDFYRCRRFASPRMPRISVSATRTSFACTLSQSTTLPSALLIKRRPFGALGRFTGILGLLTFLGVAYALSTDRKAIRWRTVAWGLGLQVLFAFARPQSANSASASSHAGSSAVTPGCSATPPMARTMVFGNLGDAHQPARCLRLRRAAHHHLRLRTLRHALPPRASCSSVIKLVAWLMQRTMGTSGRRIDQRRRQHLHGPDRSPAHHPPVPQRRHSLRAHDHHDLRHGPRLRRHHGRLHPLRHPRAGPALGRHHDRARHHPRRQNARA